ncbi:MAG: aldo/keto reductase [Bryobacteraceae bacterium]|nr:aldo/keto reductase [Bryobacteraceae bacterium]
MDRRTFLGMAAAAPMPAQSGGEYRNRQAGMAYRRLGRTGLMVSEVVCGGDPIVPENYEHLNGALERGLNYLDMAPAYHRGRTEEAYGKFLGGSSRREKVFLTTKISSLTGVRNALYEEIYKGLPGEKRAEIDRRADEMVRERQILKPGYFFEYFPGQQRQVPPVYRANAMMKDYAHRVEGSAKYREAITSSIEGSLKRVGTDYFDIMMCPHGALTPEELDIPEIIDTFQALKKQGKVRFLGVSTHTDPATVVRKAAALGHYDVAMCAYNVANGPAMDAALREAASRGMGLIGMKVAMAVATQYKQLQPVPQWRIDKVNRVVPGEWKAPLKAYIWALQNPNVTAVISNLWDETYVKENLGVAGVKVELQPA